MPVTRFGIVPALILGAALAFAGWSVGQGIERFRLADRSVTVKGLAELDVKSDFAIWTLASAGADRVSTKCSASWPRTASGWSPS